MRDMAHEAGLAGNKSAMETYESLGETLSLDDSIDLIVGTLYDGGIDENEAYQMIVDIATGQGVYQEDKNKAEKHLESFKSKAGTREVLTKPVRFLNSQGEVRVYPKGKDIIYENGSLSIGDVKKDGVSTRLNYNKTMNLAHASLINQIAESAKSAKDAAPKMTKAKFVNNINKVLDTKETGGRTEFGYTIEKKGSKHVLSIYVNGKRGNQSEVYPRPKNQPHPIETAPVACRV